MPTTRKTKKTENETEVPAESRKTTRKVTAPKTTRAKATKAEAIVEAPVAAPRTAPTHEQIAVRAYEKFAARGYAHGFDRVDWYAAEAELKA